MLKRAGQLRGICLRGEVYWFAKQVKPAHLEAINVCRPVTLPLCNGDRLQLKANGQTTGGAMLAKGEIVTVAKIKRSAGITLTDGRTLPASYRQFVRGFAVTSYGSQGKTVDHMLMADSASRAATNAQRWYVSISRGRRSVLIFGLNKRIRTSHRSAAHSPDRQPSDAFPKVLQESVTRPESRLVWKVRNTPPQPLEGGARCRVRTCDPYRVKVVLYH